MSLLLSRRSLLASAGLGGAAFAVGRPALAQAVFETNPFQLGVAAGDPLPDGFVIWTRLCPRPLEPDHGMPSQPMAVTWEVAADAGFGTIVRTGEVVARPELGHAVHVEVAGLEPARPYFYRFRAGSERSGVGRAKTTPLVGASTAQVKFGVVGCQAFESGYYTAHRKIAAEDLDFIFFYGDYIYEGRGNRIYGTTTPNENLRVHEGGEVYTVTDYRQRYAQYTMDADLQASRQSAAWFTVWDDHEIDNNWVADLDQDGTDPAVFALRKAAAMQAFYEHMPLRRSSFPRGSAMQLYRRATYGDLLDVHLLDTRQYRSDQPCGDQFNAGCDAINAREAQVLGEAQQAWLFDGLNRSQATWNTLAQQIMVMDLDRNPGDDYGVNPDSWAGYRVPRAHLLEHIRDRRIDNVVVLTGDEHQNYAGELHIDGRNPEGEPIATEFVATSISSGGDGVDQRPDMARIQAANPQLKFNNSQRGYVLCDVTPERWQTEFKVLDQVQNRNGVLTTRAKYAVEAGKPGLVSA
ncbi:Alkaline phosphatase D [Brevundimonas subvibrioides]|uniref:Alkaline phosphatase n=1 Tax=Brevundimonas subvibrioides (strain ATCC 15264 / DSM 4735 / LMG 14903 / NBRC 16000 / CB 81) TaxID=633149 RepID=D9QFP9_BRESC|nr:alkaline phosphatase D family protein [Brevundimonas subvibrioides]ADL00613.1 Alkaline phosphatase [Brevundimonas subvibrioides ATCC 15264]